MRPDLDPPRPVLVRPVRWEHAEHATHGHIVRAYVESLGAWSDQRPWTGVVLEALEAGVSFDDIVERLQQADVKDRSPERWRTRAGTYLFQLWNEGHVLLDFGAAPEQLGPYAVEKELGRGGIGVAWLCRDPAGAPVVVKHAWDYFQRIETSDRFMRSEDAILRDVAHPGVVRRIDSFESEGLLHLVREYVSGASVEGHRFSELDALADTARAIGEVLVHLHRRGYLLIDLRPANFHFRSDGRDIVLVDVGMCTRHTDGAAKVRRGLGTAGYSAPEVREEGRASTAADAYGYGRLLFSLAANRAPPAHWGVKATLSALGVHPFAPIVEGLVQDEPARRSSVEDALAQLSRL